MIQKKVDEGECTLMESIEEDGVERIKRAIDIPISQEEIDYYKEFWKPEQLQIVIIKNYLAKFFGGVLPTNIINRENMITLALLIKKKLIIEAGFYNEEDMNIGDVILPYVITGNKKGKTNTRIIRNGKTLSDIDENYIFKRLNEDKYKYLNEIDSDFVIKCLSMYINTSFTYCCYEGPDLTGTEIEGDAYKFMDELLFFLDRM